MPTNADRAASGRILLEAYALFTGNRGEDAQTLLVDLLTDLLHHPDAGDEYPPFTLP